MENNTAGIAKKPRGLLITLGILNIIFGFVALGSPLIAGAAVTLLIGIMLTLSGVFELVFAFSKHGWKAGVFTFIAGIISILCGGFIMANPAAALLTLTLILSIYFVVDGISKIVASFKTQTGPGRGMGVFGGVVSLLLGIMIWRQWPVSGVWAVGILVGIRILFTGWGMLFMGMAIDRELKEAQS